MKITNEFKNDAKVIRVSCERYEQIKRLAEKHGIKLMTALEYLLAGKIDIKHLND